VLALVRQPQVVSGLMNRQFYGDNLLVLRERIASSSVDLVYLDPLFSSDRSANMVLRRRSPEEAQAQLEAFDDTWTSSARSEETCQGLMRGGTPLKVVGALEAMRRLLGENDLLAYLVMTAGFVELLRVLKPTGSLYLHSDPTASHYLKVTLHAIFGVQK
jgi:adenine specific DNA methylase Mod